MESDQVGEGTGVEGGVVNDEEVLEGTGVERGGIGVDGVEKEVVNEGGLRLTGVKGEA
ncbi:UNVERIFIED_CONTAM: hypothetical protein Sradi_3978400, partial [Sesamum radiatum]